MGTGKVGFLFRLSMVLFLICLINLLFLDAGQPEFYIIIITIIINAIVIIASFIYLLKKRDK